MTKSRRVKSWRWRTLRRSHWLRYDSDVDFSLTELLRSKLTLFSEYIKLSFSDFGQLLKSSFGLSWLTALVTIGTLVLVTLNAEFIDNLNVVDYAALPVVQLVGSLLAISVAYKSLSILRFVWLWLGPYRRWFKIFSAVTAFVLFSCGFLVFSRQNIPYIEPFLGILVIVNVFVGIIGSVREVLFSHSQKRLAAAAKTLGDRIIKEHFSISGQQGAITRIKQLLLREKDPVQPLTIAIDGEWGDGKTYVLNHSLKEVSMRDKDYVIMRFEPWRHVSEEAIVTGFYSSLSETLSHLPGASGLGLDIAALSRNFVSKVDKTGTFESLFSQLPKRSLGSTSLDRANRLLTDNGKRLLVIIDDIERCLDKNRILRTLQLGIHLGGDIKNSTTILVSNNKQLKITSGIDEKFLQKVFDEKVTVLPPTSVEMLKITNALMNSLDFDLRLQQDARFDMLVRNVRGIKRVIIGLEQDYEGIGSNLHPQDIFGMNVLKHAYPSIFADIAQNRKLYVPYGYANYSDELFSLYGFISDREESDFAKDQVEHFKKLIDDLELQDIERRRVVSILESLFPATNRRFEGSAEVINDPYTKKHIRERRIGADAAHLDRYFLLSNSVDRRHDIEDAQAAVRERYFTESDEGVRLKLLETLIAQGKDESDEELFYGGLSDIISELDDEDEGEKGNRKILARDMLRLYFQQTDYLVRDEKRTLLIILRAIDTFADKQDYDYVFDKLHEYMNHPSTGLRLLLYMNHTRQNGFYNLKDYPGYDQLRKNILKRVDQYYITDGHDIIEEDGSEEREWRFTIAQWSTSVCYDTPQDFVKARFKRVNTYLLDITAGNPKKFHGLVMGAFWMSSMGGKEKFVLNSTPQPYDVKRFAARAKQLLSQSSIDSEMREDFKKFLKAVKEYNSKEI